MFWAIIINFLVAAWLYPELFTKLDLRMVQGHDSCGPMQYTFYLIGQFYQGGIQLFNRYDLMNGSFTNLSVGLYTPMNFLMAAGYCLLSSFVSHPAEFFHHWYVFVYYGLGVLIRAYGSYVLVYYMTKSRFAATLTSVWVNIFCSVTMMNIGGLCISFVYSCLPLVLFCIVYYWETRHIKALVALVLVFWFSISNSVYVGLGYTYQTIHLYMIDILLMWFLFRKDRKPLLTGTFEWSAVGKLVLITLLAFLPVLLCVHNLQDFEMYDSGIGESHGRFNRIFHPIAMMTDNLRYFAPLQNYFTYAFDFTTNAWYADASFVGVTTVILAFVGLILVRHSFKVIFVSVALAMICLNIPSNVGDLGWKMWAHWIDTLTNPFCFLIRSFHCIVFMWYLALAYPIGLGLQACMAMVQKKFDRIHASRINLVIGILIGVLGACWFIPQPAIKLYAFKSVGAFLFFFVAFNNRFGPVAVRIVLAGILLSGVCVTELSAIKKYVNTQSIYTNESYWDGMRVKPRSFTYMYTSPTPMVMDYQNPRILPVRFFYRTDKHVVWPLVCEFQGWFGMFYQYMPLALRLERVSHMYVPRMKIFRGIDKNAQAQEYIARDGRVMYLADAGIAPDPGAYEKILSQNLDRRVVQVEEAHLDQLQDLAHLNLPAPLTENFVQNDYVFDGAEGRVFKQQYGVEYHWKLPESFPRYLSTTVFTADAMLWSVTIGGAKLVPAQGALVTPGTFDVNNVRDGYLAVLLPKDFLMDRAKVELHVLTSSQLKDVWKNTQDKFGFTYSAPRAGWWVMHMPYDKKWVLTIDGKKTPAAKINGYYIGAPLSAGEHKILLSYWPSSPLRPLIILSIAVLWGMMVVIIRWTYRWSREKSEAAA